MADAILGMGDIVSIVDTAQESIDEEPARKLQKKIAKNTFALLDFYEQIQLIKKMGNIKDLEGMIPGAAKALKDTEVSDDAFKGIEAMIMSMTPAEREDPSIINGSRRLRIAKGSGTNVQEVNKLLKQFEETRKVMRMMNNPSAMASMMRNMPQMRR